MADAFVLSTRDLARRPGTMREVEMEITLGERMGTDVIAIPAGAPLHLQLRLEAVSEGVLVTGTASGTAAGECVRCLREMAQEIDAPLTELFSYPESRSQRIVPDEDEEESEPLPVLDGDLLDLESTVIDAVVTSLPFQPLCYPDCGGLCDVCGVRVDDAEPGHAHEVLDPRWAALSALRSGEGTESEGEEQS